jgi:hypothetical protein
MAANVVEAKEFVLKDNSGNVRARLGLSENGDPEFALYTNQGERQLRAFLENGDAHVYLASANGEVPLSLDLVDGFPVLTLKSPTNKATIQIGVPPEKPGVHIMDGNGVPRVFFNLSREDEPQMTLHHRDARLAAIICVSQNSPRVGLFDPDGRSVFTAP